MRCPRILEFARIQLQQVITPHQVTLCRATHRYLLMHSSRSFIIFVIHQIFNTPLASNQHSIIVRITRGEAMHGRPGNHHRVVLHISVGHNKKEEQPTRAQLGWWKYQRYRILGPGLTQKCSKPRSISF